MMRYLTLCSTQVIGGHGTLDEANRAYLARWKRLGFKPSYRVVDTWNEPGHVDPNDGCPVWVEE